MVVPLYDERLNFEIYIFLESCGHVLLEKKKKLKIEKKNTNWQPSFFDVMMANHEYFTL